jgi:predicted permease
MRLDDLLRDVRHTVRGLRRTPGFAVAVVLTLALGVGGNTAIFSVVDQVLLRPLPYPEGERLVRIYERNLTGPNPNARFSNGVSPANWLDWQARSKTLSSMGVWFNMSRTLTGVGEPEQLNGQFVSWEFLQALGVPPLLGRTLTADDDRRNAPRVAVLSYSLWEQRFASNPDVIGRVIQLDDAPVTIVGVMPRGFRFIQQDIDFWSAFGLDRDLPWRDVAGRFTDVVARIAPNATFASAETEMRAIAAELEPGHPMNKDHSVTLVPLREEFTGEVHRSLVVLYAAVGVLLAIACFNVANLLLARSAARRREIAVRTALGAGRVPIVRQLLVESLLLAIAGGLLGLALARWSLDALLAFAPPGLLGVSELTIDQRVLVYALGLSVLTGVIVGLMPAVSLVRRSFLAHIHDSGHRVTQSARLRQSLVVAQVAMTIVLLCAAGLLVRTVMALNGASGGIDRSNLLTMEVTLPTTRYNTPERTAGFVRQALDAIRSLPGVESVGAGNSLPIIGPPRGGTRFHRLVTPQEAVNRLPITTVRVVTPGYFRTLRIPIVRGREFTDSDPANGFVVNQAFARAYLEDVDPLATSISVRMQREDPYLPIVGVVGDVASGSVRGQTTPTVYYSNRQMPGQGMSFLIRTTQPEALSRRAVEALHGIDANLAVTFVRTLETAMSESIARERLNALVSTSFGLSGLLLAALGLYGLLAFLVTERTKEIGIRISLGAPLARVTASVVGSGLRLVAIGTFAGVVASLLLGRWLESLLFGVTPNDATTYLVTLALISVVSAVASYVPARRAAGVEPLAALRQE